MMKKIRNLPRTLQLSLSGIGLAALAFATTSCETNPATVAVAGAVVGGIIGGTAGNASDDLYKGAIIGAAAGAAAGALAKAKRYQGAGGHPGYGDQSYPMGTRTNNPNYVRSPYPPHNVIDVTGFRSGELAVDPTTNKVFRIP